MAESSLTRDKKFVKRFNFLMETFLTDRKLFKRQFEIFKMATKYGDNKGGGADCEFTCVDGTREQPTKAIGDVRKRIQS